ncbi:hypothetical protein ACF3NG_01500 [Aerococcaceae bacterium WGS1372]
MAGAVSALLIHLNADWILVFVAGTFDIMIGLYFYFMRDNIIEVNLDSMNEGVIADEYKENE